MSVAIEKPRTFEKGIPATAKIRIFEIYEGSQGQVRARITASDNDGFIDVPLSDVVEIDATDKAE